MGTEVLVGLIGAVGALLGYFLGRRQGMLQTLHERRAELVPEIYKCIIETKREFEAWAGLRHRGGLSMLDHTPAVERELGKLKDFCEENRVWLEDRTLMDLGTVTGEFDAVLARISNELASPGYRRPSEAEEYSTIVLRGWLQDFESRLREGTENDLREITKGTEYSYLLDVARRIRAWIVPKERVRVIADQYCPPSSFSLSPLPGRGWAGPALSCPAWRRSCSRWARGRSIPGSSSSPRGPPRPR
jgi:hypothetical protein